MKQYYVYILKCADKSYYTGITNNIERRLIEHKSGTQKDSYTYTRRPIKLVFCTDFLDPNQAIAFEKQVKGWTRAKKEAIINDEWDKLKILATCKNRTSHKGFSRRYRDAQPDKKETKSMGNKPAQPDKKVSKNIDKETDQSDKKTKIMSP